MAKICRIPGRGGSLNGGLSLYLKESGHSLVGLNWSGGFNQLDFDDQLGVVTELLKRDDYSSIVATSFGLTPVYTIF